MTIQAKPTQKKSAAQATIARKAKPAAKPAVKPAKVTSAAQLSTAQRKLHDTLKPHAHSELNARQHFYQALVKAAQATVRDRLEVEEIALVVKLAYLDAGSTETVAKVRASEAKKVVHAIRNKAAGFKASEFKSLQGAASKAPAVSKRGAQSGGKAKPAAKPEEKAKQVAATPVECLAIIQQGINGLKATIDDESTLDMVGELADMAQALADIVAEQSTRKAA